MSKTWEFIKLHAPAVRAGGLALAALVILAIGIWLYTSGRADKSWALLGKAEDEARGAAEKLDKGGNLNEAERKQLQRDQENIAIEKLKAIGPQLAGTPAEPTYLKKLGDALLDQREEKPLKEAVGVFTQLLEKHPKFNFVVLAQLDRGKALFELKDYTKAAADFEAVYRQSSVGEHSKLGLAAEAKWFEAKCYENQGEVAKATEAYKVCVEQSKGSAWAQLAEQALRNIRAGIPTSQLLKEVEEPPKPPAETPKKDPEKNDPPTK